MTRLKKELEKRSIVFEADEFEVAFKGIEHDCSASLVTINDKFIVTVTYCAVLDPVLRIYDRFTFELIGKQELRKDEQFFGDYYNPWDSFIY